MYFSYSYRGSGRLELEGGVGDYTGCGGRGWRRDSPQRAQRARRVGVPPLCISPPAGERLIFTSITLTPALSHDGLTGVGKTELQLRSGSRLPVIPNAARNLKSITTRPAGQCHVYAITNSLKQRNNSRSRLHFLMDTLDSSTPLRCAQNDSGRVASSPIESGSIVKYIPLSAPGGGEIMGTWVNAPRNGLTGVGKMKL